ncbi:MAG: hypothetical protein K940chlam8_00046 [Chlamydiae bacterium]|nr:hypothetical protein [Chlamydiota bacterium]
MNKIKLKAFRFKFLATLLLGLGLVTSGYQSPQAPQKKQSQEWQEFMSVIGEYKVSFPSPPQHISEVVKIKDTDVSIRYDAYIAQSGVDALCMVLIAQYPKSVMTEHPEDGLKAFLHGILSQSQEAELMSLEMTQVQGFTAVDFLINNQGVYLKGRALMVDNVLYLIAMEGHHTQFSNTDYMKFMNSFQLLK